METTTSPLKISKTHGCFDSQTFQKTETGGSVFLIVFSNNWKGSSLLDF
jgi:hypothetical protein